MNSFIYNSPIGLIRFTLVEHKLIELHFADSTFEESGDDNGQSETAALVVDWLSEYFAGLQPDISRLPLALTGTPFQQRVWERLLSIPYGQTVTYGAIAAAIGSGPRAVGGAVGRNPICIISPCHRVIAASGKPGGYAEGVERKLWLLHHEGCAGF